MNRAVMAQSRPTIGSDEILAAGEVLKGGQLAMGPVVDSFERKFKSFIGAGYACAVNAGTSALHLALLAIGVKPGDEVVLPSYSCTALLNAVGYIGATPVPADIDEHTFGISPEDVGRKVTSRTKAIIAVHTFGMAADIGALASTGIEVIEDCAQSLGGYANGKKMGLIGKVAAYSFYPTKMMTTGEGGMITTSSESIDRFVRYAREYDMPEDAAVRFNYKMTDIAAAIGVTQLSKLEGFIAKRRAIAKRYDEFFKRCSSVSVPARDSRSDVFYRYVVLFKNGKTADYFIEAMRISGIVCDRPVFKPLHRLLGLADSEFPVTANLFGRIVSIPVYPSLMPGELDRMLDACRNYFKAEEKK